MNDNTINPSSESTPQNFINEIIDEHLRTNKYEGRVNTRFPPEPNGYLHIGHAKSICLNFGLAKQYNGTCNLRFDDTNPTKEEVEYVDSIKEDINWLGFNWGKTEYYASDYFAQLYDWAEQLILAGKAYVCELNAEQIRAYRGTLTEPGKESPYRNRSVEENLDLFRRMKAGEFTDGSKTLRAKIDMASPNVNMRDPVMYRILHQEHHRTGATWNIYPMYDWAHGQSDSIEKITHSICTLEFENHRPLYDWFVEQLGIHHPLQIEFARLNLSYTVMSKRKLLQLVEDGFVKSWDDPRMPTISGLRRRGYTPESIRAFTDKIGVARRDNVIDVALLENCIREDLNKKALRRMAVLNPVRVIIDNYTEGLIEELDAVNNPEDTNAGSRKIEFSRELFIEHDDFMENPVSQFHRLSPGKEVRLRYAYIIKCNSIEKDADGNITAIHCEFDPETKSGTGTSKKKVKGTIHWVSAHNAVSVEVNLYDRLFSVEDPQGDKVIDWKEFINKESLITLPACKVEPALKDAAAGDKFQFERLGYFCVDKDSKPGSPVFNRTVTLRDSWAKIEKKNG
ncbi:MAG: glutamine--tRNA ligase/YqeY domain fusion protein [Ignavibacteriales bacterium]|nr:glutamine--tRNA ligase/YqeY domain fusion protein [Ignavibacteriales bacterium]